jgi:hypothetical protein
MGFPSSFRKKANALALKVFDRERRKSEIPQELLDRDREMRVSRGSFLDDDTLELLWRLTGAKEPLRIEGYGRFGGRGKVRPADWRYFVQRGAGLWGGYWEALAVAAQKARLYSEEIEESARGTEMRRLLESLVSNDMSMTQFFVPYSQAGKDGTASVRIEAFFAPEGYKLTKREPDWLTSIRGGKWKVVSRSKAMPLGKLEETLRPSNLKKMVASLQKRGNLLSMQIVVLGLNSKSRVGKMYGGESGATGQPVAAKWSAWSGFRSMLKESHVWPKGEEMRRLLESLEEATRYNVGGDSMTKGQMMKKAIGKEVVFMSRDSKPSFHAVMDKDGTVFKISKSDYMKSKLKDMTSPQQMTKFVDFEMSRLKPSLSMSQAVDFNMAAKGKSKGEQLAILRSMVESESAGVESVEESRGSLEHAVTMHNSMTDNNDHTGALAALAKGMGMKSEAAVASAMAVIRDYEGHSPAYLEKLRKEIMTRVHNKAKSTKFGPATVYDALD